MNNQSAFLHFSQTDSDQTPAFEIGNLVVIGNDESCNLKVNDKHIEGRIARIENKTTHYFLRELRNKVGLLLNGKPVLEAILQEGDILSIGDTELTFSYQKEIQTIGVGLRSKNPQWNEQLQTLGNVATTEFPVLILGPSGSGKEIIANCIHQHSDRSRGPFVSVNCSALTETLVESELFGHVKGAFTGALSDRKGAFESARGGTLFLDEAGDLPYALQAKLLRAIENSEIRPVGSDHAVKTDVRIVAATHQNLGQRMQTGEFRSDLYFRLAVITISPPSLKDRMEDFEDILIEFCKQHKVRIAVPAIEKLKKHTWPGNIRELKNAVARASAFFPKKRLEESQVEKILDLRHSSVANGVGGQPAGISSAQLPVIKEIEKQMIIKRLAANHGNQKRTAVDLNMPKSTLHDRLKTYDIDPRIFLPIPG